MRDVSSLITLSLVALLVPGESSSFNPSHLQNSLFWGGEYFEKNYHQERYSHGIAPYQPTYNNLFPNRMQTWRKSATALVISTSIPNLFILCLPSMWIYLRETRRKHRLQDSKEIYRKSWETQWNDEIISSVCLWTIFVLTPLSSHTTSNMTLRKARLSNINQLFHKRAQTEIGLCRQLCRT